MKNITELQTSIVNTNPQSLLACIKQTATKMVAAFFKMGGGADRGNFPSKSGAGVDFSYEARVSNAGVLDAANATLTFTLGAGLEYRGFTSNNDV